MLSKNFNKVDINTCTFSKTVLMIIIVLYHSILFFSNTWFDAVEPVTTSKVLSFFASWLNSFHVYGFVLISGYLFYYLRYEKNKYQEYKPFILNKFKRLIIPYLFVLILWVIPNYVYFYGFDFKTILKNYILGVSPNQLWFLLMLFFVFAIFWLLSDFIKNHNLIGGITMIVLFFVSILFGRFITNYFQIWTVLQCLTFFYLGFIFRDKAKIVIESIPFFLWIIADIVLFIVLKNMPTEGIIFKAIYIGISYILNIVGAIMAFTTLSFIGSRLNILNSKLINNLSSISMSIYLFHQQVIYWFIYLLNGKLNIYIHASIIFIGSFLISFLISVLLKTNRITSFLIGEKWTLNKTKNFD